MELKSKNVNLLVVEIKNNLPKDPKDSKDSNLPEVTVESKNQDHFLVITTESRVFKFKLVFNSTGNPQIVIFLEISGKYGEVDSTQWPQIEEIADRIIKIMKEKEEVA